MQWYDPLNKFMLLKQCEWPTTTTTTCGGPAFNGGLTSVFQMFITPELEYPIVCTGVKKGSSSSGGAIKLDLINMNSGEYLFANTQSYMIDD